MDSLGPGSHRDRKTRMSFLVWPRLMDLPTAAAYLSISSRTLEVWLHDEILRPVKMPGAVYSKSRNLAKVLIDKRDLDDLIDARKVDS